MYTPPTWSEKLSGADSEQVFRVFFFEALDDFYGYPDCRAELLRDEIPATCDRQHDAFVAASAHHLCNRFGTPIPSWVYDDRFYLPTPWFYLPEMNLRAMQIAESPAAFRARNIFVFANVLDRV